MRQKILLAILSIVAVVSLALVSYNAGWETGALFGLRVAIVKGVVKVVCVGPNAPYEPQKRLDSADEML